MAGKKKKLSGRDAVLQDIASPTQAGSHRAAGLGIQHSASAAMKTQHVALWGAVLDAICKQWVRV